MLLIEFPRILYFQIFHHTCPNCISFGVPDCASYTAPDCISYSRPDHVSYNCLYKIPRSPHADEMRIACCLSMYCRIASIFAPYNLFIIRVLFTFAILLPAQTPTKVSYTCPYYVSSTISLTIFPTSSHTPALAAFLARAVIASTIYAPTNISGIPRADEARTTYILSIFCRIAYR